MFHSIGLEKTDWVTNYLSIPLIHFEHWFKYLQSNNYKTHFLDVWYNNSEKSLIKNDKELVITFDDGYLDNWAFLFPLLEKYQIKATIFINPEFVDPGEKLRPNLKDYWLNNIGLNELKPIGFLNWAEIQYMQNSGLVDIQSHSMSHNWYFSDNNLIDFYSSEQKNYYWLPWIEDIKKKPFYMNAQSGDTVIEGYPIFNFGRSLGIRRYFPNPDVINYAMEIYANRQNESKNNLIRMVNDYAFNNQKYGEPETDKQMIARYEYEIMDSKQIIEKKLSKKIDFLCWPGGAYNDLSVLISEKAGYKASTIASKYKLTHLNDTGPYKRIPRFSLGTIINYKGKSVIDKNPQALANIYREFEGSLYKKLNRYAKKLYYIGFK